MNWGHQLIGDATGLALVASVWVAFRRDSREGARLWFLTMCVLSGVTSIKQAFVHPMISVRIYHGSYILLGILAATLVPSTLRRILGLDRSNSDR